MCSKKLEYSQWSLKYIFTPSVSGIQYSFHCIDYMLSFSHNDLFASPQTHWMPSASLKCSSRYPLELLSLPPDLCSGTTMPRGISLEPLMTYCLFHLFVLFFSVLTNFEMYILPVILFPTFSLMFTPILAYSSTEEIFFRLLLNNVLHMLHKHTHACVYTHWQTHIHTYIHSCMHLHVSMYTQSQIHTNT